MLTRIVIKQKRVKRVLKVRCDEQGIKKTAQIINQGGIAVFPTDTVYGIGCSPYNKGAVEKVYRIKSRDISKPVPVLVYSKEVAAKIADFDGISEKIVEKFWPGPLTLVLRLTDERIRESLNLKDKVAVRVPDCRCTLELLKECGYIVGTSANVSGRLPYTNPEECFKNLQGWDIFVDGGTIASRAESTIIEIENEEIKIIRQGALSREEITKL